MKEEKKKKKGHVGGHGMGGGSGVSGKPIESARPTWRHARGGDLLPRTGARGGQDASQQLSRLLIFTRVTGVSVLTSEREIRKGKKRRHIFQAFEQDTARWCQETQRGRGTRGLAYY